MSLRTLELFAGIAGITHGLRGFATPVAFVEIDKDAQEFLSRKFPDGKLFKDVTQFSKTDFDEHIDMITAGFPCTGFSVAGKRNGFEHCESGLFADVVRITKEYMPRFVFLENSHMLSHKYNLDVVIKTMDDIGYNCRWTSVRAHEIGARHCRYRWFCLCTRKDVDPPVLASTIDVKRFDWDSNQPPVQVDGGSYENSRLTRFSGYSVVPDQIRYAFSGLYTGKFSLTFEASLVPGDLEGTLATKDNIINHGWYDQGVYYEFSRKETPRPPLNIVVTPGEIPEKHNAKSIQETPLVKKYWCTPCASYGKGTAGNSVLTDRSSHSLPTQVKFSQFGDLKKHLSGKFCAWLMGYDGEYLDYLVKYE